MTRGTRLRPAVWALGAMAWASAAPSAGQPSFTARDLAQQVEILPGPRFPGAPKR